MASTCLRISATSIGDTARLLKLQASYYSEDAYPFDAEVARDTWQALLVDGSLGSAWVAEVEAELIAYVVLTLGYSLEYRGRDAFVDELYVSPTWRGRGLGRHALQIVDRACIELGVKTLHLEVEKGKPEALALYRQCGFTDKGRVLMTKAIDPR